MLNKLIFKLGVQLRNSEVFSSYKFLQESDKWSIEKLEEHQLHKLKELLSWAYTHSRYYKKAFDEAGVHPNDLQNLSDLERFPMISKQELIKYNDDIHIKEGVGKLFSSETSGSTGQPLVFYRNAEWDAGHRAAMFRGYSWYNVNPWDKNGYFWGYNIDPKKQRKIKFMDFLMNRFRIFSYDKESVKEFAEKLQTADYIEGYSSMIYEVAKIINENKLSNQYHLKMVKGTSEKIYDKYQDEVKKAFGKKMISEYGAAEAGIIAFECPSGNMHIVMENVIVEEVDNEIVVTNLLSKSFPIIRYKLGDYIKINKEKRCPCGREHYIIEDVLGRTGKRIVGYNNIYPSLTFYYVFKNLAQDRGITLNYQAHQHEAGRLKVIIEQNLSDDELSALKNEFTKYFKDDMDIEIVDATPIPRQDGKMKDFITTLD